ncbi:MAG: LuxR C-terminal-related transcriptional regulator [Gallionellaceae bacterium]|nr:LuxR C-terminal-related transcriptional regulator [Gallionellaceae bacterium]
MTGDVRARTALADPKEIAARMARLSRRERQVMELALAGRANREIAAQLGISPRTVEVFKARMMEKMRARGLSDLARMVASPRAGS